MTAAAVPPPSRATKRFGQNALATPANFLTLSRIAIAIPTLALMRSRGSAWLTVGLWFAITASDSLDGWLARRDGATRSGAFLDPVADKLIVLGGLAVLADRGVFPWWAVALVVVREFGISAYRSVAGPAGRRAARAAPRQVQGVHAVLRGRVRVAAADRRLRRVCSTFVFGIAVVLTLVSGLEIVRRGYTDWQRWPARAVNPEAKRHAV